MQGFHYPFNAQLRELIIHDFPIHVFLYKCNLLKSWRVEQHGPGLGCKRILFRLAMPPQAFTKLSRVGDKALDILARVIVTNQPLATGQQRPLLEASATQKAIMSLD